MLLSHQKVTCSRHNITEKQQSFTQFISSTIIHHIRIASPYLHKTHSTPKKSQPEHGIQYKIVPILNNKYKTHTQNIYNFVLDFT